jgi:hypothetical protein
MEIKKIAFLIIISFFLKSCFHFEGEKIEINYKNKTIKVLSDNYIIESIRIENYQSRLLYIDLKDYSKGKSFINFKTPPKGYLVSIDSIDYYCSRIFDIDSPEVSFTIRKKGFKGKENGNDYKEIQYFSYNKLPCNSSLIDTIVAISPYK